MKALITISIIASVACGTDQNVAPPEQPVQFDDQSEYSVDFAESILSTVEAEIDHEIDLDGYTIHMTPYAGKGCAGGANSCTNLETKDMAVAFVSADSLSFPVKQSNLNRNAAGLFCHELLHVYCYETTGDAYCGCTPDASHGFCAPFDYQTNAESTCYQVAMQFNK